MQTVFLWTGFLFLTGCVACLAVAVWWGAITYLLKCMNETWWIVSWMFYKRRNFPDAKDCLRRAIRCDEILERGEDAE